MDMRVAAYAVIERQGQILLTHWRRGRMSGWTLPGGGIESGESPEAAAKREVKEETGLDAKIGKLIGVDSRVFSREDVPEGTDPELHTIRIIYRATVKDGPLVNEVDGSSDEARWVPLAEIAELRTLSLVNTALRMAGLRGSSSRRSRGRRRRRSHSGQPRQQQER
ncbi:NUDIX hydrolase [Leucobacter sp. UCMA 4100]|uniref:NUDIX hydrolase n=1 Tax=Leucobacter sp. UCMA 4100 TaxID=2810534 RepID=UPI0022EB45D6|nr:NUDIX hydrolase [Leucobacter sp. UCMA 4100]MDA3147065.1 NUDIX hydrolase [Leucobacter sp. UCMA 4100]